MYLYNTQTFLTSMAGPNLTAPADFEIRVDFKVYKGKNNAHYGVVFEAGNSTFGRSGSTPTFDINTNYYKFGLQFPGAAGNVPADYRLERCDGNGSSCTKLVDRTQLPSGAAVTGVWDTITIRRQGATITVLVNGYQLISISDGTYTGQRKFGMYVQSADVNGTANPLEIDFDNYRVRQYP
jgi:hypothetical protein